MILSINNFWSMEVLYSQIWYLYSSISSLTSESEVCGNPPPSQPPHVSTTAFFLARGEFRSHCMCPFRYSPCHSCRSGLIRSDCTYKTSLMMLQTLHQSGVAHSFQHVFLTPFLFLILFNLQNTFREVSQKSRYVAFLTYIFTWHLFFA